MAVPAMLGPPIYSTTPIVSSLVLRALCVIFFCYPPLSFEMLRTAFLFTYMFHISTSGSFPSPDLSDFVICARGRVLISGFRRMFDFAGRAVSTSFLHMYGRLFRALYLREDFFSDIRFLKSHTHLSLIQETFVECPVKGKSGMGGKEATTTGGRQAC
jgi:hypothetical protein